MNDIFDLIDDRRHTVYKKDVKGILCDGEESADDLVDGVGEKRDEWIPGASQADRM